MIKKEIKVFYKDNDGNIFRRILKEDQINYNRYGQIILPENHYSKGYIERLNEGIIWESYPLYEEK